MKRIAVFIREKEYHDNWPKLNRTMGIVVFSIRENEIPLKLTKIKPID